MRNKRSVQIKSFSKDDLKKSLYEIIKVQRSPIKKEKLFALLKLKDKETFNIAIQDLICKGKIIQKNKNKFISTKVAGLISAKITSISNDFSFATPLESCLPDIYIPIKKLKGARVDDIVLLNHVQQSKKGFSAYVERVVFKANRFVKGTFKTTKKGVFFLADKSYRDKIPVSKKETLGAQSGDKVQAIIIKGQKQLAAKIVKVYGPSSSAKVCADAIIESYDIPTTFSQETLDQASLLRNYKISETEIENRLDLRDSCVFTIDGEDAKDLDDAISVRKYAGKYELGVHIADVSHFVLAGSSIDKEAAARGTSVYFADRVIPMLPEQISNCVCSLTPGEDKLTLSAIIKIDSMGQIIGAKIVKSVINSKVRGVYSEINKIFDKTASDVIKEKYSPIMKSLVVAKELAEILIDSSEKRGNLTFAETESSFELDQNGVCKSVTPRARGFTEKLIEQFMITANESVAAFAKKKKIPFIYRVHEAPNAERCESFLEVCRVFGFKCSKPKNGITNEYIKSILEQAKETKVENLISNRILRAMSKAIYSSSPDGHFGLALEDYCHFTSPIRRYPDLSIHRILSAVLIGTKKTTLKNEFGQFVFNISEQSTNFEIRAMNAERDAEKCYMAEFAHQHLGEIFNGTISGMTPKGMFVTLDNSVEGFIKIQSFPNKKLMFDGLICFTDLLTGKKNCIGDQIVVKIVSANVSTGTIDFDPV